MSVSSPTMQYLLDPAERAARTFVQQFVVILLATGTGGLLLTQNWLIAVDSAGFAAVVSLLTSLLTFKVPPQSNAVDLGLRVLKTFGQSFVGTLAASQLETVSGADWKGALAVAAPVALTALLTGIAALGVPSTNGASLLPAGGVPAKGKLPVLDAAVYDDGEDTTPAEPPKAA